MAVRRQPLAVIQDENAEIKRGLFAGKTNVAKSGRLKVQQTDLSNRKTLSNIMVDPELLGKSGVKGRSVSRTPLGDLTNLESFRQKGKPIKEKKAHSKNVKMGPNPRYAVSDEMKQQAELWAREGIEKCHFTGKDMEALREKIAEEEVNRLVAQALSYRSEIPCWLPGALVEQPTEIKDCLELVPELDLVEDRFTKGGSFHGMEQQDFDYDEPFYDYCLEIVKTPVLKLRTPFKDSVVIDECVL